MAFTKEPLINGVFGEFRAGDTYIVYPSKSGEAELSLRYYQLLRYVEEMSLLENDDKLFKEVFNVYDMKDVLKENYQVDENFLKKDYDFYVKIREKLNKI